MKMKKVIALAVAAMSISTTVFAGTTPVDDGDGWIIISEPYTKDEVANRTVDIALDVKSVDAATAKENGVSLGKGAGAKNDDNADFYEISLNVSNLGDIYRAYLDDGQYTTMKNVTLYMIDIAVEGIQKTGASATMPSYENVAWTMPGETAEGFNLRWTAGALPDNFVPVQKYDGADVVGDFRANATTGDLKFYISTPQNASDVVVTPKLNTVTFNVDGLTAETKKVNWTNGNTITFAADKAADPVDKPVEFSAALAEKTDFGYIWALTFTQSADKLASFTAKFEADGVEPAERTVANASDIATALKGKTAPIVLNVGLSTTKTLTKATFTADDAVETTEACVFVAPLSK